MENNTKRPVEILVLSDIHLGTYGCHAKELLQYLKSVQPKMVVLNGDIIDIWQFSKRYWPKSHMKIIKHVLGWITKNVKVHYITGNHDEMLRKFVGFKIGSFKIANKLLLPMENNTALAWFFHGDVFDITMQHSKWLAKLGAVGYNTLIIINRVVNYISEKILGRGKLSLSKKIKNSVKSAVSFINNFEKTAADIAISNKYDYVICGHIHQPEKKIITTEKGKILYLNSGDWIENLTALEYNNGNWHLYKYNPELFKNDKELVPNDTESMELDNAVLFSKMLTEFNSLKK